MSEIFEKHLYDHGIWRLMPGLWCQKSKGMIEVHEDQDMPECVYRALLRSGDCPPMEETLK